MIARQSRTALLQNSYPVHRRDRGSLEVADGTRRDDRHWCEVDAGGRRQRLARTWRSKQRAVAEVEVVGSAPLKEIVDCTESRRDFYREAMIQVRAHHRDRVDRTKNPVTMIFPHRRRFWEESHSHSLHRSSSSTDSIERVDDFLRCDRYPF